MRPIYPVLLLLCHSTAVSLAQPAVDPLTTLRPPSHQPLPDVASSDWTRQRLDYFVLAKLEAEVLRPSPAANRPAWLRRVCFDLVGLPPTPEEVHAFILDSRPDAHTRVVDRLLASPGFGEKWARHWLDVARYGEDQAHSPQFRAYPHAWRYREWVITAFNDDLPYSRFVELQIAADLMPDAPQSDRAALGLLGLGHQYYRNGQETELAKMRLQASEWDDLIDTMSQSILGITVACARCHDHKYDPISIDDYYGIAGVFASSRLAEVSVGQDAIAHGLVDAEPRDLPVFERGDPGQPGEIVKRRFLSAFGGSGSDLQSGGSGRLELARTLISADNPLTARVFVNRVWALCFGRGIVSTPNNFGSLGSPPSHPDLLDDLTYRFVRGGWSLKKLLSEIVLSSTYRQGAATSSSALERDPANTLFGRMVRRRLPIEAWRDAVLAACGNLEKQHGGPSSEEGAARHRRRTIYTRISRYRVDPMLSLFDFPDPNVSIGRRVETTTPLQHLFLLNNAFMSRQAGVLAEHLLVEHGEAGEAGRLEMAYALLLSRAPTFEERHAALEFLNCDNGDRQARWRQLLQVLLGSNDMRYVE